METTRKFSKKMASSLIKSVAQVADFIEGDNETIINATKKMALASVGTPLAPCQSADYALLDNPIGVGALCLMAEKDKRLRLSVAAVWSWRQCFDPTSPSFIGEYRNCTHRQTVKFLDDMRNLIRVHKTFCDDPLTASLVLAVDGWNKVYKTPFTQAIAGLAMKAINASWEKIPTEVRNLNKDIGYILRALRTIALRFNEGAKATGCYDPIAIPDYVYDL